MTEKDNSGLESSYREEDIDLESLDNNSNIGLGPRVQKTKLA